MATFSDEQNGTGTKKTFILRINRDNYFSSQSTESWHSVTYLFLKPDLQQKQQILSKIVGNFFCRAAEESSRGKKNSYKRHKLSKAKQGRSEPAWGPPSPPSRQKDTSTTTASHYENGYDGKKTRIPFSKNFFRSFKWAAEKKFVQKNRDRVQLTIFFLSGRVLLRFVMQLFFQFTHNLFENS